jgi:hypothetical protein
MVGNSATLKKSGERRCSSRERWRVPLSPSPVVKRRRLDRDFQRASFGGVVDAEFSGGLAELAAHVGHAQVVHLEIREGVIRIDRIGRN